MGLVRYGGRFLGLSDQMPAFGDVLDETEIRAVVDHVRGFCTALRYPLGDLNLARPVFVEKAFPEDELVLALAHEAAPGGRTGGWETALEKRLGPRGQLEIAVPGAVIDPDHGDRAAGVGDLGVSYKHALAADPRWHSIVSGRVQLAVPTGNRRNGVGAGTTVVTPQLLSAHTCGPLNLHLAVGADLPADPARVERAMLYGLALQYRWGPYKKNLVTGVELAQTQALASAVHAATVLGPTLYWPLSRRGHVAFAVGAQLPVAGTRPYDWLVGSFLLWDFADGPFWAW